MVPARLLFNMTLYYHSGMHKSTPSMTILDCIILGPSYLGTPCKLVGLLVILRMAVIANYLKNICNNFGTFDVFIYRAFDIPDANISLEVPNWHLKNKAANWSQFVTS